VLEQKEDVQLSYAEKAAAAKVLLEQYDADGVRRPSRFACCTVSNAHTRTRTVGGR
jgi:hypothetical protein